MDRKTATIIAMAAIILVAGIYYSRRADAQTRVITGANRIIANQQQILQKLDHISEQLEILKIRVH